MHDLWLFWFILVKNVFIFVENLDSENIFQQIMSQSISENGTLLRFSDLIIWKLVSGQNRTENTDDTLIMIFIETWCN